jgi:hypothetical protein
MNTMDLLSLTFAFVSILGAVASWIIAGRRR